MARELQTIGADQQPITERMLAAAADLVSKLPQQGAGDGSLSLPVGGPSVAGPGSPGAGSTPPAPSTIPAGFSPGGGGTWTTPDGTVWAAQPPSWGQWQRTANGNYRLVSGTSGGGVGPTGLGVPSIGSGGGGGAGSGLTLPGAGAGSGLGVPNISTGGGGGGGGGAGASGDLGPGIWRNPDGTIVAVQPPAWGQWRKLADGNYQLVGATQGAAAGPAGAPTPTGPPSTGSGGGGGGGAPNSRTAGPEYWQTPDGATWAGRPLSWGNWKRVADGLYLLIGAGQGTGGDGGQMWGGNSGGAGSPSSPPAGPGSIVSQQAPASAKDIDRLVLAVQAGFQSLLRADPSGLQVRITGGV